MPVREATPSDLLAFGSLCAAYQERHWRRQRQIEWDDALRESLRTCLVLVAVEGSLILGGLVLHPRPERSPETVTLVAVAVSRDLPEGSQRDTVRFLLRTALARYPTTLKGEGLVEVGEPVLGWLAGLPIVRTRRGVDPVTGEPHFERLTADLSTWRKVL